MEYHSWSDAYWPLRFHPRVRWISTSGAKHQKLHSTTGELEHDFCSSIPAHLYTYMEVWEIVCIFFLLDKTLRGLAPLIYIYLLCTVVIKAWMENSNKSAYIMHSACLFNWTGWWEDANLHVQTSTDLGKGYSQQQALCSWCTCEKNWPSLACHC